jgi:hypothetical protein
LTTFVDTLLACLFVPAVILLVGYLLLAATGLIWPFGPCSSEIRGRVHDVSGFDFEIDETYCDTIAKTATISVFALRPGQAKKILLFKFFPAFDDLIPQITTVDRHTIRISISKISSSFLRRCKLMDLTIDYKIDVIDYPDRVSDKCES